MRFFEVLHTFALSACIASSIACYPFMALFCQTDPYNDLVNDLLVVDCINQRLNDRLPVTFNNFLHGGYINMPSARMGAEGSIGVGYTYLPPYRNINARCQLFERVELSGNYRVFKGVDDPMLSVDGFGNLSDKGVNVKLSLIHPEESNYVFPGIAFGWEDILGTQAFASKYVVITQVLLDYNLEVSLGYGFWRLKRWFGGAAWYPFRQGNLPHLKNLALVAEFDSTDYTNPRREPHPGGRWQSSHFNYGFKYRWLDFLDFSVSSVKGKDLAWSVSAFCDLGSTKGFLPKISDPPLFKAIKECGGEAVACSPSEEAMIEAMAEEFQKQGFYVLQAWISCDEAGNKVLRLKVHNDRYLSEPQMRMRIECIIGGLTPPEFATIVVTIEAEGFPVQEYAYNAEFLNQFLSEKMGRYEMELLSPRREASYPDPFNSHKIYENEKELFQFSCKPKIHSVFGSSGGKFKYAMGINACLHGFWKDTYYCCRVGYLPLNNLHSCADVDKLNPSQLINVHTDVIRYYKRRFLTWDQLLIQRNANLGRGWYTRAALGYFNQEYLGGVGEVLYYPVNSPWAVGIECASLRKRKLHGFGFTTTIRKLDGYIPTYQKFLGSQYFIDLYYHWPALRCDLKVTAGKFLANDAGVGGRLTHYFPSGLRLSFWYTWTNARDVINGHIYHDMGVELSMPLDFFFTYSSLDRFNYGMSAWLRDCGYRTPTGGELHRMISELRRE